MLKILARPSLLLTFCILFLFACGNGNFFEKTIKIPDASWSYDKALPFEFEVTDTAKVYQILLEVNHAGDFGFQNCYVQITTHFPNGEERKQALSLELAAQSGIWVGKCSGNDCSIEIPLQGKAKFRQPGKHSITVEQFMRVNPLPGIKAISLIIKQLE